jgi:preprotein translocase subunit YajC
MGNNLYAILNQIFPLIMVALVLYFVALRPQQQKIKRHQELLKALKRGDRVVTSGGLVGIIDRVTEGEAHVTVAPNVIVTVLKPMITEVLSDHKKHEALEDPAKEVPLKSKKSKAAE